MLRFGFILTIVCIAWIGRSAGAQIPASPARPLDQTVEDRGPLSTSLREMPVDLRQPWGFQNVYRVPGRADLLMRVSGGVYAVFPESVYSSPGAATMSPNVTDVRTRGPTAHIPPGTVFYIGLPTQLAGPATGRVAVPDQSLNHRVESRLDQGVAPSSSSGRMGRTHSARPWGLQTQRAAPEAGVRSREADLALNPGPAIVCDRAYRRDRIVELLERATRAIASAARE